MIDIADIVQKDEEQYENTLKQITDVICADKKIKIVVIAGPSCSGKTTTTEKIVKLIHSKGMGATMISIDDFYKNLEDIPFEKDNYRDLESLSSIDLESLHQCLHDLCEAKEVQIPLFDFGQKRRAGIRDTIKLAEGEVAIIEGLHALNPEIYQKHVMEERIYKIYLNCYPVNQRNSQSRLLRRLVRDYHFRSTDALQTFSMWDSVRAGEKKYISPFEPLANVSINTFFEYEASVLKRDAMKILSDVPQTSKYAEKANHILDFLSSYIEIEKDLVPKNSLLREFIG